MRVVYTAAFVALFVSACGTSEVDPCAPNGVIDGALDDPASHCHCNEGFVSQGLRCVSMEPTDGGVVPTDGGTTSSAIDCGPNGAFDGRVCACDPGYTQTGLRDAITCVAIPACVGPDDGHEANDTASTAMFVSSGGGTYHACPANPDWYVVSLRANDELAVTLDFDGDAVDIDLFLFGPTSSQPQAVSLGTTGRESARFVTSEAGTGAILAAPYGIGEGAYQMTVQIRQAEDPMCSPPGGGCGAGPDCCSGVCHLGHCH